MHPQAHGLLFAETLLLLFQFAGFALDLLTLFTCSLLSIGLAAVGLTFFGFTSLTLCLFSVGLAAVGFTLLVLASLLFLLSFLRILTLQLGFDGLVDSLRLLTGCN